MAGTRSSPLEKRGLSPPSGGDWGVLVSCRGYGEKHGEETLRHGSRRATSLFKGGFWGDGAPGRRAPRAGVVGGRVWDPPLRKDAVGGRVPWRGNVSSDPSGHLPRKGKAFGYLEPMARSAEAARASVKRKNPRLTPPAPVPAQEAPLPTLPPCPVVCARPGAPSGRKGWRPPPKPGPSGPGEGACAIRSPRADRDRRAAVAGPPSPVNGGSQGERGVRRLARSAAEGAVSVPAPPERVFGYFLRAQKVPCPQAKIFPNPPATQFRDRGFTPMTPVGAVLHTPGRGRDAAKSSGKILFVIFHQNITG